MPGSSSPGRSAPVRGGTPSSSFVTSTPHPVLATGNQPSPVRYRPYSSGLPAPAIAVPIFRSQVGAQFSARSNDLPESPPDTPPQSPPRTAAQSQLRLHLEDDSTSIMTASPSTQTATLDLLTRAASNLLLEPNFAHNQRAQAHSAPSQASVSAAVPSMGSSSAIELMPATPEISPDNDVRHHGQKSARAFLQRIFDNFTDDVAIEDAGVELVSPGWTGAVIKTGSGRDHCTTSTSVNSTASSSASSSSDTQRTLYVSMPKAVNPSQLREQVLSILDAASDKLGCEHVLICLERTMRDFSSVLHGLCYVGGQIVAASANAQTTPETATDSAPVVDERATLSSTDPISGLALREHLVLVAIELL